MQKWHPRHVSWSIWVFIGTGQLGGVPSTFLDHKNKNDFRVQGTFKCKPFEGEGEAKFLATCNEGAEKIDNPRSQTDVLPASKK